MADDHLGGYPVTLSRELAVLRAIRLARATFMRRLVEHATAHLAETGDGSATSSLSPEELRQLKSEGVVQIAEIFFLFEETGMSDPALLRSRLEMHNEALETKVAQMRENNLAHTPEGLSRDRLAGGILDDSKIQMLVDEAEWGELRFDQSSLSSLLIELMAPESCRTLVILLARFGFLKRIGTNNVRIRSLGKLEQLYREHLAQIADALGHVEQAA